MTEPRLATQPSLGLPFRGKTAELRFVGRDAQFRELVAALTPGSAALKLVTGDAGIGKTRLVSEVVAEAQKRGHRVVKGVSWEVEGAPPFWPWTHIVRSILRTTHGTDLSALLLDDPAATRLDLFNAVAELFRAAQQQSPLIVVLEDLHRADQPSLALLRFLIRQRQSQRILFIGTYREREVRNTAAGEQLNELSLPGVRIDLDELALDELRSLIPEDGPEPYELHAIAGGNPLFAEQVLRLWVTKGELRADQGFVGVTIDSSLRSVTRSRLEHLSAASRRALSAIAVHGRPISMKDLALLLEVSKTEVSALLAPSMAAGVILASSRELDHEEVAFAHVLLANAAVELTTPDELRALHRRCAKILAGRQGRGAERAHHLLQSGDGHADEALTACKVAGDEAMSALAFEDAVSHYQQALRVIDFFGAGDANRRLLAVIDLGTAQWVAGDYSRADTSFTSAWQDASEVGNATSLALAALGPGFRFEFSGTHADERATRCTSALDALPSSASTLRARLLCTLAAAQLVSADPTVSQRTAQLAMAMAESLGDDLVIGYALVAKIVTDLDPDTLTARLFSARRVLAIARTYGDRELAANGYFLLLAALLEAGDIRAIDAELEPLHNAIEAFMEFRDSRHAGWFRCSRALLDGKAELAEQLANASYELATGHHDPDALSVWIAQISIARWMQGRVSEVEDYYRRAHSDEPRRPVWTAVLAWLWATQGRHDEAATALKIIGPVSEIPRDRHWFLTMSTLSEVAAIIGDKESAHALRDALISYASRLVPIGLGIAAWGTAARPLGLLARLLGRHDEALSHFRHSVQVCTQAGAIPWLVESQLDLAETLFASGLGETFPEAVALAKRACATAGERGLDVFVVRAKLMLASVGADTSVTDDGAHGPTQERRAAITVMGRFEVTAADGSLAHWTSRKARALLQLLIASRGEAVPRERIMDTLWPDEEPSALANRMSVAISTVRRALDPARAHPAQHFLRAERNVLQLNRENLDVDIEAFLQSAMMALTQSETPRDAQLSHAIESYSGDVFADEPYEEWARQLRDKARNTLAALCRRRAETATLRDNPLLAAELHRRVLSVDRYDEIAHRGLITALKSLGVDGQAKIAQENYHAAMSELAS